MPRIRIRQQRSGLWIVTCSRCGRLNNAYRGTWTVRVDAEQAAEQHCRIYHR
jgi:hypothetical protein